MDTGKISCTLPFTGFDIYKTTSYVQEHTLVNRGITTLGGSTIPQCIMSNNKYEAQERALMGGIYFIASYLTPILLIPVYNRHFLKNKGITKNLNSAGNKIIQVSKKFLTPDADLKQGLAETAKSICKKEEYPDCKKAFDEIYQRYGNSERLKKDLLSVHEKILMTDFITTATMWSAIPWIATEFTEKRTDRHDFSAGFNLKNENIKPAEELKKSKRKKMLWNILFSVLPGILFAKTATKGLSKPDNKLLKAIAKHPERFDYTSGTNMSKTIYAAIWILSSFPAKLISARDKNERRDRALRDIGLFTMFFGGDFLINNIAGRTVDSLFGTKVMNNGENNLNFLQKFGLSLRSFKDIEKDKTLSPEMLKRTKSAASVVYWFSLLANTALIGFALPKVLNKLLRRNISKETNVPQKADT